MASEPAQIAAVLIRRFEGLSLSAYLCPAGVPTIGYGATFYEDGRRVTLADPELTKEQAEALLGFHIEQVFLPAVLTLCPGVSDPSRLAALIDFTFNLGVARLKASTLRRRVNAADWDAASVELLKWTRAGGRELRGLVARRQAEVVLMG